MPGRSVSISTRDSTTRTNWPGSWKTTTSHGRRLPSLGKFRRPQPSSHFYHQGCDSSTRASSRDERSASRRTWFARPLEPSDEELEQFYDRLLSVLRLASPPRGRLAVARMRAGMGRQLDLGRVPGFCLAGPWRGAAARDSELCCPSGPVLRPAAVQRTWPAVRCDSMI